MARIWRAEAVYLLITCVVGVFLVCGILSAMPADSDARGARGPQFNVGCQVLDFKYKKDGKEQMLFVAIWYSTAARPHR